MGRDYTDEKGGLIGRMWNGIRDMIGVSSDDGFEDNLSHISEPPEEQTENTYEFMGTSKTKKNKIVQLNNSVYDGIVIAHPLCFEDANLISEDIKSRVPVLVDIDKMSDEDGRRVIDFISGVVSGIDGNIVRVSEDSTIFVVTPSNIGIVELEEKSSRYGRTSRSEGARRFGVV